MTSAWKQMIRVCCATCNNSGESELCVWSAVFLGCNNYAGVRHRVYCNMRSTWLGGHWARQPASHMHKCGQMGAEHWQRERNMYSLAYLSQQLTQQLQKFHKLNDTSLWLTFLKFKTIHVYPHIAWQVLSNSCMFH